MKTTYAANFFDSFGIEQGIVVVGDTNIGGAYTQILDTVSGLDNPDYMRIGAVRHYPKGLTSEDMYTLEDGTCVLKPPA